MGKRHVTDNTHPFISPRYVLKTGVLRGPLSMFGEVLRESGSVSTMSSLLLLSSLKFDPLYPSGTTIPGSEDPLRCHPDSTGGTVTSTTPGLLSDSNEISSLLKSTNGLSTGPYTVHETVRILFYIPSKTGTSQKKSDQTFFCVYTGCL